jgi:hypothetical protein
VALFETLSGTFSVLFAVYYSVDYPRVNAPGHAHFSSAYRKPGITSRGEQVAAGLSP